MELHFKVYIWGGENPDRLRRFPSPLLFKKSGFHRPCTVAPSHVFIKCSTDCGTSLSGRNLKINGPDYPPCGSYSYPIIDTLTQGHAGQPGASHLSHRHVFGGDASLLLQKGFLLEIKDQKNPKFGFWKEKKKRLTHTFLFFFCQLSLSFTFLLSPRVFFCLQLQMSRPTSQNPNS